MSLSVALQAGEGEWKRTAMSRRELQRVEAIGSTAWAIIQPEIYRRSGGALRRERKPHSGELGPVVRKYSGDAVGGGAVVPH
jgi:hypothetical protein